MAQNFFIRPQNLPNDQNQWGHLLTTLRRTVPGFAAFEQVGETIEETFGNSPEDINRQSAFRRRFNELSDDYLPIVPGRASRLRKRKEAERLRIQQEAEDLKEEERARPRKLRATGQGKFITHFRSEVIVTGPFVPEEAVFTATFPCIVTGFRWRVGVLNCQNWPCAAHIECRLARDGESQYVYPNVNQIVPTNTVQWDTDTWDTYIWREELFATPADDGNDVIGSGGDWGGFSANSEKGSSNTKRKLASGDQILISIWANCSNWPGNISNEPIINVQGDLEFIVSWK